MWNVPPGIRIMPAGDAEGALAHADPIAAVAAAMAREPRRHENTKKDKKVASCLRAFVAVNICVI
jgi:hypothetical protein